MNGLVVQQPKAALAVNGVMTVLVVDEPTVIRGTVAIIAAASTAGLDALPGDCEGSFEGGWQYGYIGRYQAGICVETSGEGTKGSTFLTLADASWPVTWDPTDIYDVMPLGAIVGAAKVVDCVRIVTVAESNEISETVWRGAVVGETHIVDTSHLYPDSNLGGLRICTDSRTENGTNASNTDLRSQGELQEFPIGCWALILADAHPFSDPQPWAGPDAGWHEVAAV